MTATKKPTVRASKKPGVKDVALAAGVSVATVSRSFNLPDSVSEDVRNAVLKVARTLGYSPNPAAKALRLQRSNIVGAVFPTIDYGFYSRLVSSFQRRMNEEGYMTFQLTVDFDNTKIYDSVRQLVERGAEALMIVGLVEDQRLVEYLKANNIPVVCTYSVLNDDTFPSIGIDNYAATTQIMEYLMQLGHREYALLSGPSKGNDRQQARTRGFTEALERHGISTPPRVYEDPRGYSIDFALRAFRDIRENHPEVTAVVCNSDAYAMAAATEARRMGIKIPEELSITGFDDQDFAAIMDPPITTISFASVDMGTMAADAIIGNLTEKRRIFSRKLESRLVVRGSTGLAPTS